MNAKFSKGPSPPAFDLRWKLTRLWEDNRGT